MSKYILAIHNGIQETNTPPVDVNNYPNVKAFMDSKIDILKKRQDKGYTIYNLRSCAYMDNFYKQKIIYSEIVQSPKFHLDNEFFYPEASTFIITGENLYSLIAFLNSKIYSSIYKLFYAGGGLGDSGFRYKKNFLETLPLVYPTIENETFFKNLVNKIYEGDRFADEQIENKISQLLGLTDDEKKYLLDI